MRKVYCYKGHYGIVDENQSEPKIYWIYEDLSPEWSNYVHGQKSMYFCDIEKESEFIFELDFDYIHVTDITADASLD